MKKCLEIVHLRLVGTRPPGLVLRIRNSIIEQDGPINIHIYSHASVSTDISIHIHLEADADAPSITELGLRLASGLKEYGMVEHTLWFEEM